MSRFIISRLAFSVVLVSALGSGAAFAQSQDSVADAARRAREQKKSAAKPVKVVTNDDVRPATPDAAPPSSGFGSANTPATPAPPGSAGATDTKDEKTVKEIAHLKELIKQAESDVNLVQRQLSLEQDTYLSKPDYAHDTAEKAIVDALKQQVLDKQQDMARLKARLAEMQPAPATPETAPPKP
jgi:hypothetical protein